MLISKKYGFIFIANPKTGTTTVQSFLLKNLDDIHLNKMPKELFNKQIVSGNDEHITAYELKKRMGIKYDDFKSFVFIRNPYEKAVSSYFFYKNGKPIVGGKPDRGYYFYIIKLNIFLARLLPFSIWSLIFPIKTNIQYLTDNKGIVLVNFIGKINSLEKDLTIILKELGITLKNALLSKKNQSSHQNYQRYFKGKIHKNLFRLKVKRDLLFFEKLDNINANVDIKGSHYSSIKG